MSSQFNYSPVLSDLSIARGLGRAGVGTIVAPLKFEGDLKYEYPEFDDFTGTGSIDTERAPGADVKMIQNDGYVMKAGIIKDHTVDVKAPMEYSAGAVARRLGLYERAIMKANETINRAHETKVRDAFWRTSKADFDTLYGASHVLNRTGTARWVSTAPKMRKDIKDLNEIINDDTGVDANTLLLTSELYNHITSADNEIKDAIKFTQFGVPRLATLAEYFEVDRVVIAGQAVDTSNPGSATRSYSKMWTGTTAMLFHSDPNPGNDTQTLGITFAADNATDPEIGAFLGIQPWYDMKKKSHMLRCNAYFNVQAVNLKCAGIVWNAGS